MDIANTTPPAGVLYENVTLNFEPVRMTYKPHDARGSRGHEKWIPILSL